MAPRPMKPIMHGGRWGSIVAGVAGAAIATSAVAMAAAGTSRTTTTTVSVPPKAVATAVATCKARQGVVAAGFDAPGFNPSNGAAAVARLSSKRLGKRRVQTRGFNFGESAGKIVSLGYCSMLGRRVKVASNRSFVSPGSAEAVVASCPRGSKVVSGGFDAPGFSRQNGPRVLALTSKRVGKSRWRVEGFNIPGESGGSPPQGDGPGVLISYAYCVRRGPALVTRPKRVKVPPGGFRAAVVRCPRGTRALSGGFDGNLAFSPSPRAAGTVTSKRLGARTWRFAALNVADSALSARLTAYAYCARKPERS